MLGDYKEEQPLAYKILTKAIKNNKLSHAYLFETNGYSNSKQFLVALSKALLCGHINESVNCHICEKIDKNIYSELMIINPDGMWIKKEQLIDLQKAFMTKSVEANKKVYIINNVECLNTSSANSLLKFLEEPEDNIIALLATDNIHRLLDTIISRCQIISLTKQEQEKAKTIEDKIAHDLNIENDENLSNMIIDTIDFIFYLEQHHLKTIVYTKDLVLNKFEDRKKLENFLDIMLLFYKDVLDYKIKKQNDIFDLKDIEKIDKKNTLEKLENKINCIMDAKVDLKVNANINLLLDKLIMELEGDLIGQDSRNNI